MRSRNSVGYSIYSSTFTIQAATITSQPTAPTTTVITEYEIGISWSVPSDLGGVQIGGYKLEIKTASGNFAQDFTNCNAMSETTIINSRSCSIPTTVLRALPYNLADEAPIFARVTAINVIGDSTVSTEGSGVLMPIADVEPDAPTTFVRNDA